TLDLDDIERIPSGHAKSLALSDREVVNAGMLANDVTVRRHQFSRSVGKRLADFGKIGIKEPLVVSSGHKADFLRVGLLGDCQVVLVSQSADFRLCHPAEREDGVRELLLCEPKQKISLVLGMIRRALQQPAPSVAVEFQSRVVAGREQVRANLTRDDQELIELQVIIAETARNWCAPREILVDKRTNHVAL